MERIDQYTYKVTWSPDDHEHVGLCVEFPSLSWLAATPEEALKGIKNVVGDVIRDMQTAGEEIPEPLSTKRYSGKLIIRITPECHRRLAFEATESKVSLNRFIADKLASG